MMYPRYQPMIIDGRRRPALWRLVLGFVTVLLLTAIWIAGVIAFLGLWYGSGFSTAAEWHLGPRLAYPRGTFVLLVFLGGFFPATLIAAALWQKRNAVSLIGPAARTLRHAVIATGVSILVLAALMLTTAPFYEPPERALSVSGWATWLPFAIVALIFQTGGEELLFRGYLQSQIAARFKRLGFAVIVPSLLFGLVHYDPSLPLYAALSVVVVATMFGVLAADLTLRTGSIGAAWGFHFANNAIILLVIAPDGPLGGLGLWRYEPDYSVEAMTSPFAVIEVLAVLLLWYLIRRALRV